jgi:hypothetical protein
VRDSIIVSQANRTEAAYPHPNLWVMPYRLVFFMPGYPYSFHYRGRDILQGTAMTWTRVQADFPLKIRHYLEPPLPLSSLNKLQLSLIGNAGTALNRTPDKLPGALARGGPVRHAEGRGPCSLASGGPMRRAGWEDRGVVEADDTFGAEARYAEGMGGQAPFASIEPFMERDAPLMKAETPHGRRGAPGPALGLFSYPDGR